MAANYGAAPPGRRTVNAEPSSNTEPLSGAQRAAPPTPGATQLGQSARGVLSLHLRTLAREGRMTVTIGRRELRRPMRLMLIVVTVAVAMLLDLCVSQATQMPWCAGTSKGDFFSYNCSLPTYEMCVQEVIAGNRGFCSPNPYYRRPE